MQREIDKLKTELFSWQCSVHTIKLVELRQTHGTYVSDLKEKKRDRSLSIEVFQSQLYARDDSASDRHHELQNSNI